MLRYRAFFRGWRHDQRRCVGTTFIRRPLNALTEGSSFLALPTFCPMLAIMLGDCALLFLPGEPRAEQQYSDSEGKGKKLH